MVTSGRAAHRSLSTRATARGQVNRRAAAIRTPTSNAPRCIAHGTRGKRIVFAECRKFADATKDGNRNDIEAIEAATKPTRATSGDDRNEK
jgi:hypothetical protein